MLQAELDEELNYSKHAKDGYNSGNSRNGSFSKAINTENVGEVVLNIPRDRKAEFEPRIIPKGQTISSKIEDAILGMYSRAMTASDVCNQVQDIYGNEYLRKTKAFNMPGSKYAHSQYVAVL